MKIKFSSDDDIPLNKQLNFPTITVLLGTFLKKMASINLRLF